MRAIERRRKNAALFDRMTLMLSHLTDGKPTKQALLLLAERIAANTHVKIDRGAKRSKDCLICWFCEQACELAALNQTADDNKSSFDDCVIDDLEAGEAMNDDEPNWVFAHDVNEWES
jgi:formate hydrogenlyase subunit 6/NADH:ubiquinone oxidoreductase subunit I